MNAYERFSIDRKLLQKNGYAPEWMSTASYQLLSDKKYLLDGETPRDAYIRVANRAGYLVSHLRLPDDIKKHGYKNWEGVFFDVLWKGWLSPSTPALSNTGTNRGHPISCSGSVPKDSIEGFYDLRKELAVLTKEGYGTSTTLDPIRPRGSKISSGGKSNGSMQLARGIVQDMKEVSQGDTRNGSCGLYINPLHLDFDEYNDQLISDDYGWNIGWNFDKSFDDLLERDPDSADLVWKKILKTRCIKGKGYMLFLEKVNKARPKMYKDKGLYVYHSNLCAEITLFDSVDYSFSCVLSSVNVSKYDEWKDFPLFKVGMAFLDALISDMLEKSKNNETLKKIYEFTKNTRAIGLGVLGLSTYYQQNMWAFGSMESILFNQSFFKKMDEETLEMSKYMAREIGEPEWMKGYGERFSHRIALPPTMSTSVIMGGVSQGIEPVYANVYFQNTAGGGIYRINPPLLKLMKERGVYNEETIKRISENQGSVFGEDWLSESEKEVFRTAFELNQETILLMASHRQKEIDRTGGGQGQSLNVYFKMETPEEYISKIHWKAYKDPYIKSLYYVRTLNEETKLEVPEADCPACHG